MLEFLFATQQHRASLSRNQKAKPTTEARRHGEKPEKPVAPRRRGEEFNFDEKFAQKTRKFGISNTEARRRGENQRNYSCRQNQVVRLIEAAVKIIEEYNLMKLTAAEWKILIELLLNPPAPNEALRLATKRY